MSADTLRRAANLMRERAEASKSAMGWAMWKVDGLDEFGHYYIRHPQSADRVAADMLEEDAEHIASWHPAVALAVADSLDQAAAVIEEAESGPLAMAMNAIAEPLVTVARAYLGETA